MNLKIDIEPSLCRCCGSLTKFRILNRTYFNFGRQEVYSDIIKECFGIEMLKLDGDLSERLICGPCMHKLIEAWNFKRQVQETEDRFRQKHKILSVSQSTKKDQYDDSEDTLSDGFDDELDAEQLEEYHLLANEVGASETDSCFSTDEHFYSGFFENINTQTSQEVVRSVKNVKKKPENIGEKSDAEFATCLVRYSYACPFKNRFNHILCYYCSQYFLKPELLREHTLSHPQEDFKNTSKNRYLKVDITRIDCKLCSERIDSVEVFKRHLASAHKKPFCADGKDGVIPFKLVQNVNVCILCGDNFPQFHELVKHMDQHYSNYVCETCGIGSLDEKGLQAHMLNHEGRRYPCDQCGSSLKSEYTLLCHKRRMHGQDEAGSDLSDAEPVPSKKKMDEVDVPCQGCDKTFKSRKHLAIHVRKAHMNYKHVCQVCGQKFFTRFALNNHMPTHTGERNFKCSECGKSYPRLKTLKEHMRIHNNDRRYRCQICEQAFIQNCSLKGHMKSKHPEYR